MSSFLAALCKEWLEQWRTYRFLIVAVVLAAFGLLSPLLAKFTPELLRLVPGAEQFALLLGILVTMGSVAQEKDKGTAAMMLVKPLPRGAFILAKFLSTLGVFSASILLAGVGAYYYTLLLIEPLPFLSWWLLNGLLLGYTMVYVALTLLFSTLSRSQVLAGGLSLTALIFLGVLGSLPRLGEFLPGQLLSWAAELIAQTGQTYWPALWISLGIIAGALLGAWLVFRSQEL